MPSDPAAAARKQRSRRHPKEKAAFDEAGAAAVAESPAAPTAPPLLGLPLAEHVDPDKPWSEPSKKAAKQRSHATGARARRLRAQNKARCHGALLQPGFDLSTVARHNAECLGDETCFYCKALLYPGEAEAIKGDKINKRGCYCCAEGQVELPPTKRRQRCRLATCLSESSRSVGYGRGGDTTREQV